MEYEYVVCKIVFSSQCVILTHCIHMRPESTWELVQQWSRQWLVDGLLSIGPLRKKKLQQSWNKILILTQNCFPDKWRQIWCSIWIYSIWWAFLKKRKRELKENDLYKMKCYGQFSSKYDIHIVQLWGWGICCLLVESQGISSNDIDPLSNL